MDIEDCKPGNFYKLSYKLAGQRHIRYAQLQFLGYRRTRSSLTSDWSGRPTIGSLTFNRGEIYTIHVPAEGSVKTTYFDKRSPQ